MLGAGVGGFDFAQAARIMRDAARTSEDARALDEIVFYGYVATQAETLRHVLVEAGRTTDR